MNKLNFLITLIILLGNSIIAQQKFNGIVEYQWVINNPNGVSFANPYLLYFNKGISFYVENGDASRVDSSNDQDMANISGKIVEEKIMKSTLSKDYVYTNVDKDELIFQEEINQKIFVVNDSIANIKWELSTENKKIGKYTCQKAVGLYRGRTYTVWFTTEIPVSHGPWKLRGLPGLILEVTEETGKYEFRATKVDLSSDKKVINEKLKKPKIEKVSSMEKYIEAIKNKQKDFETMLIASSSERNMKFKRGCDECPKAEDLSLEIFK